MHLIEQLSDADVAEVRQSAGLFQDVEATTADLRGLLDFLCGLRWLTAGMRQRQRSAFEAPLVEALGRQPDNAYKLLARGPANSVRETRFAFQPHSEAPRGVCRGIHASAVRGNLARRRIHRAARGLPALGSGIPRRVAPLGEPASRRRLRRRDRQSALGPHQAARSRMVRHPRPRDRPRPNRRRPQSRHQATPQPSRR